MGDADVVTVAEAVVVAAVDEGVGAAAVAVTVVVEVVAECADDAEEGDTAEVVTTAAGGEDA